MAGHNKWSKVKRQKAVVDARKSKIWARLSRDIIVAAREGGGDPDMNPRLAQAIERAKPKTCPRKTSSGPSSAAPVKFREKTT